MGNHQLTACLEQLWKKIKEMVDVDSVIGKPITTPDGTTVIPISKSATDLRPEVQTFRQNLSRQKDFFGGGAGAGITITQLHFYLFATVM